MHFTSPLDAGVSSGRRRKSCLRHRFLFRSLRPVDRSITPHSNSCTCCFTRTCFCAPLLLMRSSSFYFSPCQQRMQNHCDDHQTLLCLTICNSSPSPHHSNVLPRHNRNFSHLGDDSIQGCMQYTLQIVIRPGRSAGRAGCMFQPLIHIIRNGI